MAKKGSIWTSPSKYGTYKGPRGNPERLRSIFDDAFANSNAVKSIVGASSFSALGLIPSASEKEIRKAYRSVIIHNHPDHGGDEATFRKLTEAYEAALKTAQRRSQVSPRPRRPVRDEDEVPDENLIIPQLLTEIDEDELQAYLDDDDFGAQEKKDGRHITLRILNNLFTVRNKKGKSSDCSKFETDLRAAGHDILIDGEQVGTYFYTWDILEYDGQDLRNSPYIERYRILSQVNFGQSIKVVPLVTGSQEKRRLLAELKAAGKEGIVFKRLAALFSPGKGVDQFKFKFYAEASVIVVAGRPGKASIGMELIDENGQREFVGFCSCALYPLPPIGSVAEIKYLYAYKGGSLYQSAFKEIRDDIDVEECTTAQLKYKYEDE
jgi:hypothetical protein